MFTLITDHKRGSGLQDIMKIMCIKCHKNCEHEYLPDDTKYYQSMIGPKTDYRKTKCKGCGFVFTYDFSGDR